LNGLVVDFVPLTNRTNALPVMNGSRILPTVAYTNDTLKGYCSANDSDGDNVSYYYQWYKNGVANASGLTSRNFTQGTEINVANITSANLVKGQSWILGCRAFDGYDNSTLWKNSTSVTINNSPPSKVNLSYPANNDTFMVNRTPRFNWSAATDIDGDSIHYNISLSTESDFSVIVFNVSSGTDANYTWTSELDLFRPYFWKVIAYDGTTFGNWSDTWNFTLQPSLIVSMLNSNVTFSSLNPGESDNTTDNSPLPFIFRSDSNTYINMTSLTISNNIWTTQPLNTSYWQLMVRSKSNDGSFNESASMTSWFNSTNVSNVIAKLNYTSGKNNVSVDTKVTVPTYEGAGNKSTSIVFYWEASP
jgi:hypothetical protein